MMRFAQAMGRAFCLLMVTMLLVWGLLLVLAPG